MVQWNAFLGKGKAVFIKHFKLNIEKTFSGTKNAF
jgi:hypothetical protein